MEKEYLVDLNSDLGESFGNYRIPDDHEIIGYVTSVNAACGCHAGDPIVMNDTVIRAAQAGVQLGAHPGYPDLQGFGRRKMALSPDEVRAYVIYQLGALRAFCEVNGVKMQHVKPHGALYNTAGKDPETAAAIADAVYSVDKELILMGLAGSEMVKAGRKAGLKVAEEVFADRAYEDDGSLRARSYPDAMITDEDEAVKRVIRMIKEGKVRTVSGGDISIKADSVCVHGDGAKALAFVKKIRAELSGAGIAIAPLKDFI